MSKWIGNAFSLNMLDPSRPMLMVVVGRMPFGVAHEWVRKNNPTSCVGHESTAAVMSADLGIPVAFSRQSVRLADGDELLVAQYVGPRLEEGATALPDGARIDWILVQVHA